MKLAGRVTIGHTRTERDDSWPAMQRALEETAVSDSAFATLTQLVRRAVPAAARFPRGIYIFAFHTVVDPARLLPWEAAYDKGCVSVDRFEQQLSFLTRALCPLAFSELDEFRNGRAIDRAYCVVTFDDGYSNVLTHAAPVISRYKLRPTLFVNGRFAEGAVYYRVLAALLTKNGHSTAYACELRDRDGSVPWSTNPELLFHQTKNDYQRVGIIEAATEAAYRRCIGDPADLKVHLTPDGVGHLEALGWEIGNHTFGHPRLSALDDAQVALAIEENEHYWAGKGVRLLPAVAYPNGTSADVCIAVKRYLNGRPNVHGVFCNGGVNLRASRTEWLRLFTGNDGVDVMGEKLRRELARTAAALRLVDARTKS